MTRVIKTLGRAIFHRGFRVAHVENFTDKLGSYFTGLMPMAPSAFKRMRRQIGAEYNTLLETYDVLLSPVLSTPPPPLGYLGPDVPVISLIMRLSNYVNYTIVQNATGAPAISLPIARSEVGLPIGVQCAGAVGDERTLLELAYELEAAHALVPTAPS